MTERLLVAVLGNRNAGKSTTWTTLFDGTIRTGKHTRPLNLNPAQTVEVFIVNGSPEERQEEIENILPKETPQIVLCSTQYKEDVRGTFNYFFRNGYEVFVQWLNPGNHDAEAYEDELGIQQFLLENGATLQIRDGQIDPKLRVKEIRQFILGWATYRDLVFTTFPD